MGKDRYGYWVFWIEECDEQYEQIEYCKSKEDMLKFVNQEKFLNGYDKDKITNSWINKIILGTEIFLEMKEIKIIKEYTL